jgi:asparagine synthase (glutamine-hydrolysing)
MCGILGYGNTQSSATHIHLPSWAETLHHRGPDEFGVFSSDTFGIGMRRLSIIDVKNGHQPIFNESREIIAVFNGQIYNYKELATMLRLKGHILNSDSDGEVIVHLYEEFGELFVEKIDGMFAIALVDLANNSLFLYRDRFGKKPLVYELGENGEIFFASEIKSLLAINARGLEDVSSDSLGLYFALGYIPAPRTIFTDISKLPPASYLKWSLGKHKVIRYWSPEVKKNVDSLAKNKDAAKELLVEAIRKRLMSERPLGAFLSGGIDSSLVVALLSQMSPNQLETFSVGFEHIEYDESQYALEVSKMYNTKHTEIILRDKEILDGFMDAFNFFDEPFADSSWLATFLLSRVTSKSVTVAMSGDGGDEAFGGYLRYSILRKYAKLGKIIYVVQALDHFHLIPKFLLPKRARRLLESTPASHSIAGMYEAMMTLTGMSMRKRIFKKSLEQAAAFPHSWFKTQFGSTNGHQAVMHANMYDIKTYLPDDLMYKVDIASMASSLEVRAPFLDPAVVEFGLSLPLDQRVTDVGKVLLREIAYEYLPRDLIDRPKMGFGIPRSEWLSGPLADILGDVLLSSDSLIYNWLDKSEVEKIYDEFKSGAKVDGTIWSILCLELWGRRWLIP